MARERLERCVIHVDQDGQLTVSYKWSHLKVSGSLSHDEDVSTWDDDEIIDLVVDLIGADDEDRSVIELENDNALDV